MDNYKNFIGGQEISFSGQVFSVVSPFFEDYKTHVVNSNIFDIKTAISKTKKAINECIKLDFHKRQDILTSAAKKITFTDEDIEYVVKMTGMPKSNVKKYLDDIPDLLQHVPKLIKQRIGIYEGRIGRHPIKDTDLFKFLEPIHGYIYAVTPGNDPRVVPYVASWLVTLGLSGIFKVSGQDVRIPQLVLKKLTECGYPNGALNVVCWDTKDATREKLNFMLVDSSKVVWAFGDARTIDSILRYEVIEDENGKHTLDHFSDKIILRHASGRAAGIVDERDVDINDAVNLIVHSSTDWPIGCNSMKALFDACDTHDELVGALQDSFNTLSKGVGDPMKSKTKVGYSESKNLDLVLKRVEQLETMGLIKRIAGGHRITANQATPMLLKTTDSNSEFLSTEYPIYLLTIKKTNSYEEAIQELNLSAGDLRRLSVSILSADHKKILQSRIHAYHIKRWKPTTELDVLFHEGQDYLHKLTEPQIHRTI